MKQAIMNAARKSAEAAERTARLGTLRAQMEKVRRLDLAGAYAEMGRRAYEVLACADRFGASFKQIAEVERQMDEKRKSAATDRYATIWERIKATAISAKKQVEAEALAFRRKTLFESLGRAIADAGLDLPDLAPQQQAVARSLARLEALAREFDALKAPAPPAQPPPPSQREAASGETGAAPRDSGQPAAR